ncbi:hypothetical protein [Streptomyces yaizuensis]|uniref:Uncharacterized protein n=1 Tax=Streptomyces yaizuensis TaxID=2989713 RepID=A0ABQ5P6M4_9ACTN|nr:hypothetical protein [Streptomyces sp. YSPA8]GLF98135.1 hypothetical protein SYYSPA8_27580 [Streptomyces sp. YSPA8]
MISAAVLAASGPPPLPPGGVLRAGGAGAGSRTGRACGPDGFDLAEDLARRMTGFLLEDDEGPMPIGADQAPGLMKALAGIAELLLRHPLLLLRVRGAGGEDAAALAEQTREKARRQVAPGDMAAVVALVQLAEAVQELLTHIRPAPRATGHLLLLPGGAR